MNYKEAHEKFNTDNTICIVVETKEGLRALTENNFAGGCCSCCKGCDDDDNLIVKRVVDMETMEIFYEAN
jgi:hypothetical protein